MTTTAQKHKHIQQNYFDKFNGISSFDEYDSLSGKKLRTVNFVLYKSIDEYDKKSGKKFRTINFSTKDNSKITSIQYFDTCTGKIAAIALYKRDGKTISTIKRISQFQNCDELIFEPALISNVETKCYDNIRTKSPKDLDSIDNLIDLLYKNNFTIEKVKN